MWEIYMTLKRPGLFNANPKQVLRGTSVETDKLNIYMNTQKANTTKGIQRSWSSHSTLFQQLPNSYNKQSRQFGFVEKINKQINKNNSPRNLHKHIQLTYVLTNCKENSVGERKVFAKSGGGSIEYPYQGEKKSILVSHHTQTLI